MSQSQDNLNTIEVGEGYRKLGDDEVIHCTDERAYGFDHNWTLCSRTMWAGRTVGEWRAYNEYSATVVVRRKNDSHNQTNHRTYKNVFDNMIKIATILQPSDSPGISVQLKGIELIRSHLDILQHILEQLNK